MECTLKLRRKAAFYLSSVSCYKNNRKSSIRDKMKYKFNILNKGMCQLLLFYVFFNVFWPTKLRLLTELILVFLYARFISEIESFSLLIFFSFEKDEYNVKLFRCSLNKRKALPLVISIAWRKFIASKDRWQQKIQRSSGNIVERLLLLPWNLQRQINRRYGET